MKFGLYAYPVHGKRETRAAQGLAKIIKNFLDDIDVFVAPEYANVSRQDAKTLAQAFRYAKDPSRKLLIPGSRVVIDHQGPKGGLHNRVFVLDHTGVIHQYDQRKHSLVTGTAMRDHYAGELSPFLAEPMSGDTSPVFNWNRRKFGIDICVDNSNKYSDRYGPSLLEGVQGIDYHIIIASGMEVPENLRGRYNLFLEGGGVDAEQNPITPAAKAWHNSTPIKREKALGMGIEKVAGKSSDVLYIFDLPD